MACSFCRTFELDAEQSLTTGQLLGRCVECRMNYLDNVVVAAAFHP